MIVEVGRRVAGRLQDHTFSALAKYPNFRLYWFGALSSNIGTWIQMLAQSWLVYQLTGSAFYLGLVGFASAIPSLFLSLFGGVLADRLERRRLMIGTQTGAMIMAFILSYLTLSGIVNVWFIMAISFISGAVNALNTPVRQTIISDLVDKDDLMNAIAVNSAQFQASRMLGPAIAGLLVALVGPGWCFFINGLSFLTVIFVLCILKLPPLTSGRAQASMWNNMTEGVRYIRSEPTILTLIALAAVPSLFGMPYQALMPAFAEAVLDVGASGQGLLMSAAGAGALVGALTIATLGKRVPRGRLMLGAVTVFGSCLVAFGISHWFGASLVLMFGVGVASMMYSALNQTFLQTMADVRMRGRVMSLLTLTTFGLQPFGQLAAGTVAAQFGPPSAVIIGGAICVLFAVYSLARRPSVRSLI